MNRAAVDALREALTTGATATAVLEARLGRPLRAVLDRDAPVPEGGGRLGGAGPVAYRRVTLMAGGVAVSHADNWYLPDRLTPIMLAALADGVPFGRAITALGPVRRTLSVDPMGDDPVLRVHALVLSDDGAPVAEVVETYRAAALTVRSDRPVERC